MYGLPEESVGCKLKGKVVLKNSKSLLTKHMVFVFLGKASVACGPPMDTSRPEYSESQIIYRKQCIFHKSELSNEKIPAGIHEYHFEFDIPGHLPSSFKRARGKIEYACYAILARPIFCSDVVTKKIVTLNRSLTINSQQMNLEVGTFNDKIRYKINTPLIVYREGGLVSANITLEILDSNSMVEHIEYGLKEEISYHTTGEHEMSVAASINEDRFPLGKKRTKVVNASEPLIISFHLCPWVNCDLYSELIDIEHKIVLTFAVSENISMEEDIWSNIQHDHRSSRLSARSFSLLPLSLNHNEDNDINLNRNRAARSRSLLPLPRNHNEDNEINNRSRARPLSLLPPSNFRRFSFQKALRGTLGELESKTKNFDIEIPIIVTTKSSNRPTQIEQSLQPRSSTSSYDEPPTYVAATIIPSPPSYDENENYHYNNELASALRFRHLIDNKDKSGSQSLNKKIYYLKPIQTGYPESSDSKFLEDLIDKDMNVKVKTLYTYKKPLSPHLAVGKKLVKDQDILDSIKKYISKCIFECKNHKGILFLETAGGVASPVMSGTLQSDFYRPLRLPIILIGDSDLGGISTTISSFESLYLRGYDIPLILMFENIQLENHMFLINYFKNFMNDNNNVLIETIPPPPLQLPDLHHDQSQLKNYFSQIDKKLIKIMKKLKIWHHKRFDRLVEMDELAKQVVWWPFTQHNKVKKVNVIDSAFGDFMVIYNKNDKNGKIKKEQITKNGKNEGNRNEEENSKKRGVLNEVFDGAASWWTQGLGHGSSKLALTASHAAGRYGHVLFPESINEPALLLSQTLLRTVGNKWATRVFYSDNGSTAMEVALKMALKSSSLKYNFDEDLKILGLNGNYHGDTIGVMDACGPNIYNQQVVWYTPRGVWLDPPQIQLKNNIYNLTIPFTNQIFQYSSLNSLFSPSRLWSDPVSSIYKNYIDEVISKHIKEGYNFGALLIEPILMGAGGMILVDPLFQRLLVKGVREFNRWGNLRKDQEREKCEDEKEWKGLPVIFDEVFTGLWRLGKLSGADILGVNPDIAAYAKLLTGGLLPLATTLSTESIFNNFLGDTKVDSLLHGHSYTAHPIGCMMIGKLSCLPNVKGLFAIGTILAIELKDIDGGGYASEVSLEIIKQLSNSNYSKDDIKILSRPLGNVIYLISSLISEPYNIRRLEKK
ncbi:5228_t:CDS:10 [Diversispora eburnea]|uniref:5228_t:CDS:1 n=2 Tax=Diversisporales TaxID=214509 RepID=A0A9N9AL19_9GLOM|nr:5228_t:CDS:10 [Diversispora eburnea]